MKLFSGIFDLTKNLCRCDSFLIHERKLVEIIRFSISSIEETRLYLHEGSASRSTIYRWSAVKEREIPLAAELDLFHDTFSGENRWSCYQFFTTIVIKRKESFSFYNFGWFFVH